VIVGRKKKRRKRKGYIKQEKTTSRTRRVSPLLAFRIKERGLATVKSTVSGGKVWKSGRDR